jgi:hypothetical protein
MKPTTRYPAMTVIELEPHVHVILEKIVAIEPTSRPASALSDFYVLLEGSHKVHINHRGYETLMEALDYELDNLPNRIGWQ